MHSSGRLNKADKNWNEICGLYGDSDPGPQFLETSKLGLHEEFPPQESIAERMSELVEAISHVGCPATVLPAPLTIEVPLSHVIASRISTRDLQPKEVNISELATLLHHAYGVTRSNEGTGLPWGFRTVPSGGGLYPLEIFFQSTHVTGLTPGLYHYYPPTNEVRLIRPGDHSRAIAPALVEFQRGIAREASIIFFITATFERSVFKYGDRGYRFIFLEAGHVAQNFNLTATGLRCGCLNIGGYHDRTVDRFLGLDGVSQSTIYMVAVSKVSGAD
jgi:SagB-type dehydrogenase family enzyme